MNRIDVKAVIIAFAIEIVLDMIIFNIMIYLLAQDSLIPDMTEEAVAAVLKPILDSAAFLGMSIVSGTATSIGGGYMAARFARKFPLYQGLAVGVVGVVYTAIFVGHDPGWYFAIGLLLPIPASIYGGVLAKAHLAASESPSP
jgi:hypothetical protein